MKKYFNKKIRALFLAIVLVISIFPVSNAYCDEVVNEDSTVVSEPPEISGRESDIISSEILDRGLEPVVTDRATLSEHDPDEQAADENTIIYDPQPTTREEIQMAIDAYESEYQAVLAAEGFSAALEVPKPHWQYEISAELMPEDYNCQLVDWDEDFGAEYYTFFPNPLAVAGFGDGEFANEPPAGLDIRTVFSYFVGNTKVDSKYTNVAIATLDKTNQFGAMWDEQQLDLNLPFSAEMYLHLGHSANPASKEAVADGMTFTMHNYEDALSKMIGGKGEGLGVWTGRASGWPDGDYLPNSLVIEFDTYINHDQWSMVSDPVSDDPVKYAHCALIYPRENDEENPISESEHKNTYYFQPSQNWVPFAVKWEPKYNGEGTLGGTLTYSFEGEEQTEVIDDVVSVFKGTKVWWGFTGATGAQTAVQAAAITKLPSPQYSMDVVKSVENEDGGDIDGKYAYAGDTLTYTIRVTGSMTDDGSAIGPIYIKDKLPEYVEDVVGDITVTMGDDSVRPFTIAPDIDEDTHTLTADTQCYLENSGDWLEITFDVKLKEDIDAGTVVKNTAKAEADNFDGSIESNTVRVTIIDASRKAVASDSAAGVDGKAVTVGEEITYEIYYSNSSGSTANLTITDTLPKGVEYVPDSATGDGVYDAVGHKVVWEISGVESGAGEIVTIKVKVTKDADRDNDLVNRAILEWSNDRTEKLSTKNPVTGYKVTYYGNGGVTTLGAATHVEGLYPTGDDYIVLNNNVIGFERGNATFIGWTTEEDGSGTVYAPDDIIQSVTEDIFLYAQWGSKKTSLTLLKVDAKYYTTPLSGAEFDLYCCTNTDVGHIHTELDNSDSCWEYAASAESLSEAGQEGLIEFSGLVSGTYLLVETKAPSGYQLPKGQWIIGVNAASEKVTSEGILGSDDIPALMILYDGQAHLAVGNFADYKFPVMGGGGIFWLMVLGGVLLAGGMLLMSGYRRMKYNASIKHNNN